MPNGSHGRTQAISVHNLVEINLAPLSEEENNERIKRLARKILRVVEGNRGNRSTAGEDIFSNGTFEQDLAI
jgi:hypothetical protein